MIRDIQAKVAEHYGIPVIMMRTPDGKSGSRRREFCHPRQVAMRLAMLLTEQTETRVGQFFGGRDHTTVMNACRRVDARRKTDPKLHSAMRRISLELVRG